jgi:hypothetical protein
LVAVVVNGTPLTVVTVVVPSERESGGLAAASSTMSLRDEKRDVCERVPAPNRESTNVELQVTSDPDTLQTVSDVTVTPSMNVCTDRWLEAAVRQLAAELPVDVDDELLGVFGEPPPPVQAIAPAQMTVRAIA